MVASDGREVPLELASMPLRNDGKVQILVVARDVERRQTQRVVLNLRSSRACACSPVASHTISTTCCR